jgi:TIR domain
LSRGGPRSSLLKVFLCYSSDDKPAVRVLYKALKSNGFDPWLDEENLLAGQDWNYAITKAVRESDAVIVCLSKGSVTKTGYVQKEIKFALDVADEQPEGAIFLIPVKLEDCDVPDRLRRWHWVNLHETNGYEKLVSSLTRRASNLDIDITEPMTADDEESTRERLYDEDIVLEADTHRLFPFELDEGEEIVIDLRSNAPVDVLIMEEHSYQDWKNKIAMDTLLSLLYKEYLGSTELHTIYHTHRWRSYILIVRNQQVDEVKVQLKIDR